MPESIPLSIVIITKNEEARLRECLDSAAWAGEIVIVDDESTDRTVEVARQFTDRIIRRKMDIEGRHRNFAYAQARYDWVFSLDADERITPQLRDEILALLRAGPDPKLYGYTVPRRNFIGRQWVRHGGWYPSPQLKLFRKDKFRYEESEVHPRAFMDSDSGALTQDLIHYSYRDLADFLGKLNRQTTLEARKWLTDGRKMSLRRGLWRTVDRFRRSWWSKKAHKDGALGFIVSIYAGLYQLLSYAKYWHAKNSVRPELVEGRAVHASTGSARTVPRPGQLKLSAVILTKNAADKIDSCLASLRWVDEIVVVDGGSTDGTVGKAQQAGAKIVTDLTSDDFGHLRNHGTEQASGDWILQLDADEVVTVEFRADLEKLLREPPAYAAYKFRRQNVFLGRLMRYGGWDHDSLHLFQKGKAHYEGRVHEKLLVSGSVGKLKTGVCHEPFLSLEEFVDRQNRYTTLEARQILEEHGVIPEHLLRYQMTRKPVKLFWKIYVKKQGWREGTAGLLFAALYSFVHFLKWTKVWEKEASCASSLPGLPVL